MPESLEQLLKGKTYRLYTAHPIRDYGDRWNRVETLLSHKAATLLNLLKFDGTPVKPNQIPKGEITKLSFRPIELSDYEYDEGSLPLRCHLEFNKFRKKGDTSKEITKHFTMIMLPSKVKRKKNAFQYYPLIFMTQTANMLSVVQELFEELFLSNLQELQLSQGLLTNVVNASTKMIGEVQAMDMDEYLQEIRRRKGATIQLEYFYKETPNLNTIKCALTMDDIEKMNRLLNNPDNFLHHFQQHIYNTTKLHITAFELKLVSVPFVAISQPDKIKFYDVASPEEMQMIYEMLTEFAIAGLKPMMQVFDL